MRKYLFLAFLGFWTALVPFLPIQPGSTQTLIFVLTGFAVMVIAFLSLRNTDSHF